MLWKNSDALIFLEHSAQIVGPGGFHHQNTFQPPNYTGNGDVPSNIFASDMFQSKGHQD